MANFSFFTGSGPGLSAFAGSFRCGLLWQATSYCWLTGYRQWVPVGGDTSPVGGYSFALQQLTDASHSLTNVFVPGSSITGVTGLTAGAWNVVNLTTPLAIPANLTSSTPGPCYAVNSAWTAANGFPDTDSQFGAGQPFAAGITNGPIFAFSDQGASAPMPFTSNLHQGLFDTSATSLTVSMPVGGNVSTNFGIDIVVTNTPPVGTSYRLWPNMPYAVNWVLDTANNFTLGVEYKLSQSCTVNNMWFYSPAGVTQLPTDTAIYSQSSQTIVAGSHNASPAWSGAAGSGWVSAAVTGVTLPAGSYRPVVYNAAATPAIFNATTGSYWGSGGPGTNGLTFGPITAPNNATADTPGQSSYNQGPPGPAFPGTNVGPFTYWVDMEVTPQAVTSTFSPLGARHIIGTTDLAVAGPVSGAVQPSPGGIQVT